MPTSKVAFSLPGYGAAEIDMSAVPETTASLDNDGDHKVSGAEVDAFIAQRANRRRVANVAECARTRDKALAGIDKEKADPKGEARRLWFARAFEAVGKTLLFPLTFTIAVLSDGFEGARNYFRWMSVPASEAAVHWQEQYERQFSEMVKRPRPTRTARVNTQRHALAEPRALGVQT